MGGGVSAFGWPPATFQTFNDWEMYNGRSIAIWKRARLCYDEARHATSAAPFPLPS